LKYILKLVILIKVNRRGKESMFEENKEKGNYN